MGTGRGPRSARGTEVGADRSGPSPIRPKVDDDRWVPPTGPTSQRAAERAGAGGAAAVRLGRARLRAGEGRRCPLPFLFFISK